MPQVRRDGSGALVPVRGGARLLVTVTAPVLPTGAWWLPNGELIEPAGYRTSRDLEYEGSFEGGTSFGSGVRAGCRCACSSSTVPVTTRD